MYKSNKIYNMLLVFYKVHVTEIYRCDHVSYSPYLVLYDLNIMCRMAYFTEFFDLIKLPYVSELRGRGIDIAPPLYIVPILMFRMLKNAIPN